MSGNRCLLGDVLVSKQSKSETLCPYTWILANYCWLMHVPLLWKSVWTRSPRVPASLHPCIADLLLRNCSLSISALCYQDLKCNLRTSVKILK